MPYEVFVEKKNNSHIIVHSDEPCVHDELYEHFKVKDPSFRPNKFSKYDGMIRLYNKNNGQILSGLLFKVLARLKSYNVTIDDRLKGFNEINENDLREWISSIGLPFELYDYQFQAIYDSIRLKRLVVLADTGAGKSAIIYCVVRFWFEFEKEHMLIMVPTILLRKQMVEDFISYGWSDAKKVCQEIEDSKSKTPRKPIIVSTWQSLQNLDSDYFHLFDGIIVDEVHGAKADVQSKILTACINASDRVGFTGTLDGTNAHEYQIQGLLGPAKRYVDTKQLQSLGQASMTQVIVVHLRYNNVDRLKMSKLDYQGNVEFLLEHEERRKKIASLALSLSEKKENSLIIFERVESGLYKFKSLLDELGYGDRVRVIESGVKLEQRFDIKNEMEVEEGLILLATWGTMSTGVSIKKIHNLFFASSSKGLIRILQSLGRVLRIHETKEIAKIFDFVDDNRKELSSKGFFIEHAKERYRFYTMKKHPVKNISIQMSEEYSVPDDQFEEILSKSNIRKKRNEDMKG